MPQSKKRIAVAMSGGVDSSVAAALLHQAGHELVGLTAWTLNGPGKCCNDALVNAGRVCEMLDIPYDTVDLRAEFSHFVMDYYNQSYQAGLTPNPCVECNRYVKWEQLVRYAVTELGVDYVATGHYAMLRHGEHGVEVWRSRDEHKDQTYMMARVYPQDLEKTLFPLGEMTKPEVLALARQLDLPTAYSKESQDICFVLDGQHHYMDQVFGKKKGPIVDMDSGRVLGEHDGYYRFTLGQRKGIGVAAGRPVYVVKIDPLTNRVYLGDMHHLQCSVFTVVDPHWLSPVIQTKIQNGEHGQSNVRDTQPVESMIKIRYNSPPTLGLIEPLDGDLSGKALKVTLSQPQSAITPGQIAAFYDVDFQQLYGGGYVERHLTQQSFNEVDWAAKRDNLPNLFCHS